MSIQRTLDGFENTIKSLVGSESSGGVIPGVKVSDITFVGIPVRVYEPPAGGEGHLRRGLVYIHGGGWAFGSASEYERDTFTLDCKLRHISFNTVFLQRTDPMML